MTRISTLSVLFVIALCIILGMWASQSLTASPINVQDHYKTATIEYHLSASRLFHPSDCTTLQWQAENVQAVFFDTQPTVGNREQTLCGTDATNHILKVIFLDDSFRTYSIPISFTTLSLPFRLATLALLIIVLVNFAIIAAWVRDVWTLPVNPSALLIVGVALAFGLVMYVQTPKPALINEQYGNTQLSVRVNDVRHLWLRGCYQLTWQAESIAGIYINGVGQAGEGDTQVCPTRATPLEIMLTLPDGEQVNHTIPITYLAFEPLFWLWGASAVGLIWIGFFGLTARWVSRMARPLALLLESTTLIFPILFASLGLAPLVILEHISISMLSPLLWVSLALAVTGWFWINRDRLRAPLPNIENPMQQALFIIPLLVALPMAITLVFIPAMQFGGDSLYHSPIAYSILNQGLPPDNPFMAGQPIQTYWMYNTMLATLAATFSVPPMLAAACFHLLMFIGLLYWTAVTVNNLLAPRQLNFWVGMLTAFALYGGNLLISYFLIENGLLRGEQPVLWFMIVPSPLVMGHPIITLNTIQGYPIATTFLMAIFAALSHIHRYGLHWKPLFCVGIGFVGILAYHSQSALILLVMGSSGLLTILLASQLQLSHDGMLRQQLTRVIHYIQQDTLALVGIIVSIGLGSIGVIRYIILASAVAQSSLIKLDTSAVLIFLMIVGGLPFFILGVARAVQQKNLLLLFWGGAALGAYVGSYIVLLGGLQTEKFMTFGTMSYNFVVLTTLWDWLQQGRIRQRIVETILYLLLVNIAAVQYVSAIQPTDYSGNAIGSITIDGTHVNAPQTAVAEVCRWVREHTPVDAVIVAETSSLYDATPGLCERSVFLGDTNHVTVHNSDFVERSEVTRIIFGNFALITEREQALKRLENQPYLADRMVLLLLSGGSRTIMEPLISSEQIIYQDPAYTLVLLKDIASELR